MLWILIRWLWSLTLIHWSSQEGKELHPNNHSSRHQCRLQADMRAVSAQDDLLLEGLALEPWSNASCAGAGAATEAAASALEASVQVRHPSRQRQQHAELLHVAASIDSARSSALRNAGSLDAWLSG